MSTDISEPTPLTPSMFLRGRSITTLPHKHVTEDELSDINYNVTDLQKRFKILDNLFENCWIRWRDEYISASREAHMAKTKRLGQTTNIVKVGDVVLVHSDISKRTQWPLAIETRVIPGNDGLVRSVEIFTKNGSSNRPITKLYPLEVSLDNYEAVLNGESANEVLSETKPDIMCRPKRDAAAKADIVIKGWAKQLTLIKHFGSYEHYCMY